MENRKNVSFFCCTLGHSLRRGHALDLLHGGAARPEQPRHVDALDLDVLRRPGRRGLDAVQIRIFWRGNENPVAEVMRINSIPCRPLKQKKLKIPTKPLHPATL